MCVWGVQGMQEQVEHWSLVPTQPHTCHRHRPALSPEPGCRVLCPCYPQPYLAGVKGAACLVPSVPWQMGKDTTARVRTMHCPD